MSHSFNVLWLIREEPVMRRSLLILCRRKLRRKKVEFASKRFLVFFRGLTD